MNWARDLTRMIAVSALLPMAAKGARRRRSCMCLRDSLIWVLVASELVCWTSLSREELNIWIVDFIVVAILRTRLLEGFWGC